MQPQSTAAPQRWDAALYETHHQFVWQYGESLLELLAPQAGDRILDLGCGTGQLTQKIAAAGATVTGIDADRSMIEKAQQNYPHLEFCTLDARSLQLPPIYDAVFSNAALHWIQEPDAVVWGVYQALKSGGRFVAEFGGKGNIQAIVRALYESLQALGYSQPERLNPWYFPSIGDYATRLEQQGFDVTYAVLFDRPTPLEGESGLANWLRMFANRFFAGLAEDEQAQVIRAVEERLRPALYRDRTWSVDYRRIRVVAVKPPSVQ